MVIGLITLGLLIVLLLFGLTQKTFDKMRISATAAIVLILAMAVGIIIPSIPIGSRFSMSIGGFFIPVGLAVYFMARLGLSKDMWRCDFAILAVAATTLVMRMWIPMESAWLRVLAIFSMSIIAAGISYIVARSRRGTYAAAVLGVTLGEVLYFLIGYFGYGWDISLRLGAGGMFDTIIMSSVLGVVLAEIIGSMRERSINALHAKNLQHEAGKDFTIEPKDDYESYFKD